MAASLSSITIWDITYTHCFPWQHKEKVLPLVSMYLAFINKAGQLLSYSQYGTDLQALCYYNCTNDPIHNGAHFCSTNYPVHQLLSRLLLLFLSNFFLTEQWGDRYLFIQQHSKAMPDPSVVYLQPVSMHYQAAATMPCLGPSVSGGGRPEKQHLAHRS